MAVINGTNNNDTLVGTAARDDIYARAGHDIVLGGGGDDFLFGDAGTDTVRGDGGNDVVKGGTGISYLYGGEGNDQLFYDPTTENIATVGNYLSGSLLNGDGGTDTLNVFNHATYTSGGARPAYTFVNVNNNGNGSIRFHDPDGEGIDVGQFFAIEEITVSGNGMSFFGAFDGQGTRVTGTTTDDVFYSYYASDTFLGGGGNDDFHIGGGSDTAFSFEGDADNLYFDFFDEGTHAVTGFNGEGAAGGDRIYIDDLFITDRGTQVVESGGRTSFILSGEPYGQPDAESTFTVDAVGLIEGVDWFLV